jgi:cell division protein ZapA
MEELDSKQLTIIIAGRPYPLKIKAIDEPVIRRIVREINEKINKFQLTHPGREKQDCLAMTLLACAIDLHKVSNQPESGSSPEISERLSRIQAILDQMTG